MHMNTEYALVQSKYRRLLNNDWTENVDCEWLSLILIHWSCREIAVVITNILRTAGAARTSEAPAGGVRSTASWCQGVQEEDIYRQVLGGVPATTWTWVSTFFVTSLCFHQWWHTLVHVVISNVSVTVGMDVVGRQNFLCCQNCTEFSQLLKSS